MQTENLWQEAITLVAEYMNGGPNWKRGLAVDLAARIATAEHRDAGDVFADIENQAEEVTARVL
jgi:hypothetical protein